MTLKAFLTLWWVSSTEYPHVFSKIIKNNIDIYLFSLWKNVGILNKQKAVRQVLTNLKEQTVSKCHWIIYIKVCIVSKS